MLLKPRNSHYSTKSEVSSLPRLYLEEDDAAGQYQIHSYGGPATASTLTFSDWRPIGIPSHLVDSTEPTSPESENGSVEDQKLVLRKTAGRLGAWIKRSGKALVVRFQSRNRKKEPQITEFHIAGYEKPELAGEPILQLPQDPWQQDYYPIETQLSPSSGTSKYEGFKELPDSSLRSELPDTPTLTELPAVHNFSELETNNVAVDSSSPQSSLNPQPLARCTRTTSVVSPLGTVKSSISSADTAVDSIDTADSDSNMDHRNTVARGLSIVGSVKYSCDSGQNQQITSPTELVKLVSLQASKLRPRRNVKAKGPPVPSGKPKKALQDEAAHNPARTDSYDKAYGANELARHDRDLQQRDVPLQSTCAGTSTTLVYQQDLHVTANMTQIKDVAPDTEDRILRKIERLLEEKLHQSSAVIKPTLSDSNVGNPAAETTSTFEPTPTTLSILQSEASTKAQEDEAESDLGERPATLNRSDSRENSSGANTDGVNGIMEGPVVSTPESFSAEHVDDMVPESAISPISPLSEEQQAQRQDSIVSQIAPITPMTPMVSRSEDLEAEPKESGTSEIDTASISSVAIDQPATVDTRAKAGDSVALQAQHGLTELFVTPTVLKDDQSANQGTLNIDEPPNSDTAKPTETNTGNTRFLAEFVDYQAPAAPLEATPVPLFGFLTDDKIPIRYKNTRFKTAMPQIDTSVADISPPTATTPGPRGGQTTQNDFLLRTGRPEPQKLGNMAGSYNLVISALINVALRSILWLQRHGEGEPPVADGQVRIRWRCSCGESLYDDFVELRSGAASRLEARLNQHAQQPYSMPRSSSRSSPASFGYTPNSSTQPSSAATSHSSASGFGTPSRQSFKNFRTQSSQETLQEGEIFPYQGARYLLTCASEAKNTPKLAQIPLHKANILSDKDLAVALRDHYASINQSWYRKLRLRGLTSIEFIQFYKHRNHFADIRKCPDVPPDDFPHDYEFDPSDVLPPVGPHYLVHLFKHPHEYDDEMIAYLSIPKKTSKLAGGIGWVCQSKWRTLPETRVPILRLLITC